MITAENAVSVLRSFQVLPFHLCGVLIHVENCKQRKSANCGENLFKTWIRYLVEREDLLEGSGFMKPGFECA
jgi:chloramphenicol 3-O-phosphotransferase